jgi:hypothetical protein
MAIADVLNKIWKRTVEGFTPPLQTADLSGTPQLVTCEESGASSGQFGLHVAPKPTPGTPVILHNAVAAPVAKPSTKSAGSTAISVADATQTPAKCTGAIDTKSKFDLKLAFSMAGTSTSVTYTIWEWSVAQAAYVAREGYTGKTVMKSTGTPAVDAIGTAFIDIGGVENVFISIDAISGTNPTVIVSAFAR